MSTTNSPRHRMPAHAFPYSLAVELCTAPRDDQYTPRHAADVRTAGRWVA